VTGRPRNKDLDANDCFGELNGPREAREGVSASFSKHDDARATRHDEKGGAVRIQETKIAQKRPSHDAILTGRNVQEHWKWSAAEAICKPDRVHAGPRAMIDKRKYGRHGLFCLQLRSAGSSNLAGPGCGQGRGTDGR